MTKEELISNLINLYGTDALEKSPNMRAVINAIMSLITEETPTYHFSLREDIKDDKRFLPTRAEPKASGWDVRACMKDKQPLIIKPLQYNLIPLGCRGFCPEGWWYELKPRSSTFAKKHIHNLYGTIDETFEGELVFACQYIPPGPQVVNETYINADNLVINYADAIGQIIPIRRQEMNVKEWSNEEYDSECKERNGQRGAGGFGSTDSLPKMRCKRCGANNVYQLSMECKGNSHEFQLVKYGEPNLFEGREYEMAGK